MVYINSRGEVVNDSSNTPVNIFWKIITFIVLFFKSLVGIEDNRDKNDGRSGSSRSSPGGFFGGGGSGGRPGGNQGPRGFGPRGFKSVTDLAPPPSMGGCSGGACG